MELDYQTHLAWFAVSVLNDHFPHPEEDDPADDNPDMGSPGCVVNCGPCSALHWFSQTEERRAVFEAHVRLTGFHIGGWSHWDGPTRSSVVGLLHCLLGATQGLLGQQRHRRPLQVQRRRIVRCAPTCLGPDIPAGIPGRVRVWVRRLVPRRLCGRRPQ